MKVLVIGAGKMISAILAGLDAEGMSSWGIVSKTGESAKKVADLYGLQFVDKQEDFGKPDWILLGCKPQQLKEIKIPNVPVMSVLAAIPEKSQKEILGVSHLVRIMPNLPVRFNKGISLVSSTSSSHLAYPLEVFGKLGTVKVMSEGELEELTLLTGSGPALFFEFAKSLASAFTSLSQEEREELTKALIQGVAASTGEDSFQKLIDAVTSKGGVTIAVLEEWRRKNLSNVLADGVKNGLKRTEELKSHLLQS